mmetsp:Transcript_43018/g.124319  ORF Transcript_43018/g.124319 Transcript_43018/m.124319 type:complete len:224 (+) Transcript_43018:1323-1994(+)
MRCAICICSPTLGELQDGALQLAGRVHGHDAKHALLDGHLAEVVALAGKVPCALQCSKEEIVPEGRSQRQPAAAWDGSEVRTGARATREAVVKRLAPELARDGACRDKALQASAAARVASNFAGEAALHVDLLCCCPVARIRGRLDGLDIKHHLRVLHHVAHWLVAPQVRVGIRPTAKRHGPQGNKRAAQARHTFSTPKEVEIRHANSYGTSGGRKGRVPKRL